jgi:hypothetical protein
VYFIGTNDIVELILCWNGLVSQARTAKLKNWGTTWDDRDDGARWDVSRPDWIPWRAPANSAEQIALLD